MRFRIEYAISRDTITIHLDQQLTTEASEVYKGETWNIDTQPDYIKNIWQIEGIERIVATRYRLVLVKGELFEWTEEIIKDVILSLLKDFEPVIGTAKETAPPMRHYFDAAAQQWYKTNPEKSPKKLRVFTLLKVAERKKKRKKIIIDPDMPPETPENLE